MTEENIKLVTPKLKHMFISHGVNEGKIDDAIQEVFFRVLMQIKNGVIIENFEAFCIGHGKWVMRETFRKPITKTFESLDTTDLENSNIPEPYITPNPDAKILLEQVIKTIKNKTGISKRNSSLFIDRVVNEIDGITVGKKYNMTRLTVDTNVCKVRKLLREAFGY